MPFVSCKDVHSIKNLPPHNYIVPYLIASNAMPMSQNNPFNETLRYLFLNYAVPSYPIKSLNGDINFVT